MTKGNDAVTSSSTPMIDLSFSVTGRFIPADHAGALWQALEAHLPWLKQEPHCGVIPLRGHESREGIWLPRRTKLTLRIPTSRVSETQALVGKTLSLETTALEIGPGALRPFTGHPSLHAHLVASTENESGFLVSVQRTLQDLGVSAQWICGRPQVLHDHGQIISGYSLVLHHLKPEQSLRMQCLGLGDYRRLGCGLFIPFKVIPDLE